MADVPMKVIIDCTSGVVSEVPLTDAEIAAQAQAASDFAAKQAADAAAKQADEAALAATNAKLIALGLTQDDINNLLNAAKN
jgi:ribosomal protein S11